MIQIETWKEGSKAAKGSLTYSDGFMVRFFGCWYKFNTLEEVFDKIREHYGKFGMK